MTVRKRGSPLRFTWEDLIDLPAEATEAGGYDLDKVGWVYARLSEQWLRGVVEAHFFRSGLRILLLDLYVDHDLEIIAPEPEPMAGFGMVIEGRCVKTFKDGRGRTHDLAMHAGLNVAGGNNAEKTGLILAGGQRHKGVQLRLKRARVPELIADWNVSLSEPLSKMLLPSGLVAISFEKAMSLPLVSSAHQVLACSRRGPARRLFMESKGLEILACQIEEFSQDASDKKIHLNREDIERLHYARTILEKEFADPPALMVLSRRAGINDFKLKRGFREVFGTTVFGFVRQLRMEKARLLLDTSDMTVAEIALAVGYNSLGHFAGAFKKSFGIVPREYRLSRKTSSGPTIRTSGPETASGKGEC